MNEADRKFMQEVASNIEQMGQDKDLYALTQLWIKGIIPYNYAHNFSWLGRPVMQVPQDIYAMQELIWNIKPDLVIETGIAHGGSLIMSASMLALLDYCEAVQAGKTLDPKASKKRVLGLDIEIRPHNREAIEAHPMAHLIEMIEGSSVAPDVIERVKTMAKSYKKILVSLDSDHTHNHVLAELKAYAPLTSVGSYCVVWDTGIEDLPEGFCANRPWGKGNNPKTAVWEYLKTHPEFEIDKVMEHKLLITAASDGYLKRVR
ncbi:MAG: cephalosporin hydroxylase family protein [Deltaproteobacteria bacterium]|nr:cephalosporin hydroxylase family protein [Deltaproteobacteria bacterium]